MADAQNNTRSLSGIRPHSAAEIRLRTQALEIQDAMKQREKEREKENQRLDTAINASDVRSKKIIEELEDLSHDLYDQYDQALAAFINENYDQAIKTVQAMFDMMKDDGGNDLEKQVNKRGGRVYDFSDPVDEQFAQLLDPKFKVASFSFAPHYGPLFLLSQAYQQKDEMEKALKTIDEAITWDPYDGDTLVSRVGMLIDMDREREGAQALEESYAFLTTPTALGHYHFFRGTYLIHKGNAPLGAAHLVLERDFVDDEVTSSGDRLLYGLDHIFNRPGQFSSMESKEARRKLRRAKEHVEPAHLAKRALIQALREMVEAQDQELIDDLTERYQALFTGEKDKKELGNVLAGRLDNA